MGRPQFSIPPGFANSWRPSNAPSALGVLKGLVKAPEFQRESTTRPARGVARSLDGMIAAMTAMSHLASWYPIH